MSYVQMTTMITMIKIITVVIVVLLLLLLVVVVVMVMFMVMVMVMVRLEVFFDDAPGVGCGDAGSWLSRSMGFD